jgi:hypothetical protein
MIIVEKHPDGSQTILYEIGDRVRLKNVPHNSRWLAQPGELATVTSLDTRKGKPRSTIDFLYVRTDAMVKGHWGELHVAPWDLEIVEN